MKENAQLKHYKHANMKLHYEVIQYLMFDVCMSSKFQHTIIHSVRYFLTPELILINQYEEYTFLYLFSNDNNIRTAQENPQIPIDLNCLA